MFSSKQYIFAMRTREISGCGQVGFINRNGTLVKGDAIVRSVCNMKERGNGLGAGYAVYGVYPELKEFFALHVMLDTREIKSDVDDVINKFFVVTREEEIPIKPIPSIKEHPYFIRYFVEVRGGTSQPGESDEDIVVRAVMTINEKVNGAYVVSSGRNMAVFKGVGEPDDIAEFFQVKYYEGYSWIAHTRFPTNTPGWWGGAHPFTILDWSIVHNGEISSYGTNRNFLEMFGYKCTLLTDTEVVAYALDFLLRKQRLPLNYALNVLSPPFWKDIDESGNEQAEILRSLRTCYAPLTLNGPFAFIFGFSGGIVGFNDRIKLRPLFAAEKGETIYIASEEAAIRAISSDDKSKFDRLWMPRAGEPVVGLLNNTFGKF